MSPALRIAARAALVATLSCFGFAHAQVVGSGAAVSINSGESGVVAYGLSVGDSGRVDGVNGELVFDSALLTNPSAAVAPGQPAGYVAEGNVVSAGVFRFVLYQDPPGDPLDLSRPILHFGFDAVGGLVGPPSEVPVTFTVLNTPPDVQNPSLRMPAAARIVDPGTDEVISLGVEGGQSVTFEPVTVTVVGIEPPVIVLNPESQIVNPGKDVTFHVAATGLGTLSYEWRLDDVPVPGGDGPVLSLPAVTVGAEGPYHCVVSNEAGGTPSNVATLDVQGSVVANDARHVSNTIPLAILPYRVGLFTVTMRNDSQVSWSPAQGIHLGVRADPGFLPAGARFEIAPASRVVGIGEEVVFSGAINAPGAPGMYTLELQMSDDDTGPFGDIVTANIVVGDPVLDFGVEQSRLGWFGGVVEGGESVSSGASGLCMTAALTGENLLGWVSPERYIANIDTGVFRLRVEANTTQSAEGTIPRWEILYDNFNSSGFGNTMFGEGMFLDQADGANGVGRPQGRTSFEFWAACNASMTDQFRAQLNPFTDAFDDLRIIFRTLDIDSHAALGAADDFGTVCVQSLRVDAFLQPNASATVLYDAPLDPSTHFAQTGGQAAEGAGVASFDPVDPIIRYSLTTSGAGSRKTPGTYIQALDPTSSFPMESLFPVAWDTNILYRGTVMVAADVSPSNDPVDAVFTNLDTATTELVVIHVSVRGSPPDNFFLAASPRPGPPQPYMGYMWGHNRTALPSSVIPGADRLRLLGDFFNVPTIAGTGSGLDPLSLHGMRVEAVVFPGM